MLLLDIDMLKDVTVDHILPAQKSPALQRTVWQALPMSTRQHPHMYPLNPTIKQPCLSWCPCMPHLHFSTIHNVQRLRHILQLLQPSTAPNWTIPLQLASGGPIL